jgi:hypothetical protein
MKPKEHYFIGWEMLKWAFDKLRLTVNWIKKRFFE